jgi:ABC-type dipeptide/oligopeptide/nickel transport system permease subunit
MVSSSTGYRDTEVRCPSRCNSVHSPTWGKILFDSVDRMTAPSQSACFGPGLAISLTVLAVNYIGDSVTPWSAHPQL